MRCSPWSIIKRGKRKDSREEGMIILILASQMAWKKLVIISINSVIFKCWLHGVFSERRILRPNYLFSSNDLRVQSLYFWRHLASSWTAIHLARWISLFTTLTAACLWCTYCVKTASSISMSDHRNWHHSPYSNVFCKCCFGVSLRYFSRLSFLFTLPPVQDSKLKCFRVNFPAFPTPFISLSLGVCLSLSLLFWSLWLTLFKTSGRLTCKDP